MSDCTEKAMSVSVPHQLKLASWPRFIIATMSGSIVTPRITNIEGRIGGGNYVSSVAKAACGLDAIVGICLAKCSLGFIIAKGNAKFKLKRKWQLNKAFNSS